MLMADFLVTIYATQGPSIYLLLSFFYALLPGRLLYSSLVPAIFCQSLYSAPMLLLFRLICCAYCVFRALSSVSAGLR